MLTCNNDCIYQCDGNCILDEKDYTNSVCPKLKDKVNGFFNSADVNKLNTIRDIGAH